ncbi:unnamed protein product, partial [Gongylonema pulchrum]
MERKTFRQNHRSLVPAIYTSTWATRPIRSVLHWRHLFRKEVYINQNHSSKRHLHRLHLILLKSCRNLSK